MDNQELQLHTSLQSSCLGGQFSWSFDSTCIDIVTTSCNDNRQVREINGMMAYRARAGVRRDIKIV